MCGYACMLEKMQEGMTVIILLLIIKGETTKMGETSGKRKN